MKPIDFKAVKKFISKAEVKLDGDWVVIGSTVLSLLGDESRFTVDIDFIPMNAKGNADSIALMGLAEELGLPVESVNTSGAYFLERISNYRDDLVLVAEKNSFKLYRPNNTLYIILKLGRFADKDLDDCLSILKLTEETPDYSRISQVMSQVRIKNSHNENMIVKLEKLDRALIRRNR